MRTTLCLILIAMAPFIALSLPVTNSTANLLLSTFYSTSNDTNYIGKECCVPLGSIQITVDPATVNSTTNNVGNLSLVANSWVGDACTEVQLNSSSVMSVPFYSNSSFTELELAGKTYDSRRIGIQFSGLEVGVWPNSTDKATLNVTYSYDQALKVGGGVDCTVSYSRKSGAIISAFSALVMTVAAIFMF